MTSSLYFVLGSEYLYYGSVKKNSDGFYIQTQPGKYYYHIGKTNNFENTSRLIKKKFHPAQKGRFFWVVNFIEFNSEIALENFIKYFKNKMNKVNNYYKKVHKESYDIQFYDDTLYENNIKINFVSIVNQNRKNKFSSSEMRDFILSSCYGWQNLDNKNFTFNIKDLIGLSDDSEVFDNYDDKKANIDSRRKINECQYIYIVGSNLPNKIDNFKIGIAKDADKRLYDYKTHSPIAVKMHYAQSCLGETSYWVERDLKSILRQQNLYQEWYRMNLYDLINVIKGVLKTYGQPEYKITKFVSDSSMYWDRKNFFIFYDYQYYYFRFNNHTTDKQKENISLLHVKDNYGGVPISDKDEEKDINDNVIKQLSNNKNLLETLEFFYKNICKVKNVKGHKDRIKYDKAYF